MPSSRLIHPTTPGGLLSPNSGDELTPAEELVVQAIAAGTYFRENVVPTGAIDGANVTFTLPFAPNPTNSLEVFLNGQKLKITDHYSVSGTTLTMANPPRGGELGVPDDVIIVCYRVAP